MIKSEANKIWLNEDVLDEIMEKVKDQATSNGKKIEYNTLK